MKVTLIRHGQTKGNQERRFIGGGTDEPVTTEGLEVIANRQYPETEALFVSPMIRCVQTAECIYRGLQYTVIEEFRECDFGILEGKCHQELDGDPQYQAFLDAKGALPYPGGESLAVFSERVMRGFEKTVKISRQNRHHNICCIVHGGTMMAVLHTILHESRGFYDWYAKNGCGYQIEIEEAAWEAGHREGRLAGQV